MTPEEPGRKLYLPPVTGPDDTCPLPLIQPPFAPAIPPARKPRRNWPWVVGVIVLLIYIIGGGGGKNSTSTVTTAEPPAPAAPPAAAAESPAPAAPPADLAPGFGDGTYVVGTDIVPGTYETTGPAAGGIGTCSWSRLKDTSGNLGSIIANDVQPDPTTVTISKADGAFVTAGCNNWHKVVSLDPRPPAGSALTSLRLPTAGRAQGARLPRGRSIIVVPPGSPASRKPGNDFRGNFDSIRATS
jgi:hypothetical protein